MDTHPASREVTSVVQHRAKGCSVLKITFAVHLDCHESDQSGDSVAKFRVLRLDPHNDFQLKYETTAGIAP
jgi:hypothetical protein